MNLAELEESIKELRPQGEACQEEKNRGQLALAEKRLNLQHLADNIREKYDVDIRQLNIAFSDNGPYREDLIVEIGRAARAAGPNGRGEFSRHRRI